MSNTFRSVSLVLFAIIALSAAVVAQDEVYSDPNVDFSFTFPDAKWRRTGDKPTSPASKVEFIYGDRMDGLLEVRRITVAPGKMLAEVIEDEEQRERFKRGFVAGREENFNGRLRGTVVNYEYVASSRTFAGRAYFLQVNPSTVYILRFVGERDSLRSIRNQLDSIARTFSVKQAAS